MTAIADGPMAPTGMALPAVLVRISIGVTAVGEQVGDVGRGAVGRNGDGLRGAAHSDRGAGGARGEIDQRDVVRAGVGDVGGAAPSGVMAIADGDMPTVIAAPAVLVATSIGVTSFELPFVTYAAPPSGVIAIADGSLPTAISATTLFAAMSISVTLFEPRLTTKASAPSGVMAIAEGLLLTSMGSPGVLLATSMGVTVRGEGVGDVRGGRVRCDRNGGRPLVGADGAAGRRSCRGRLG